MPLGDKIYEDIIGIVASRDGKTCAFLVEELFTERGTLLRAIKLYETTHFLQ